MSTETNEEEKPKKKRSGAYSRNKGNAYERKIIKELTDIGYKGLKSSRSESKNLDSFVAALNAALEN